MPTTKTTRTTSVKCVNGACVTTSCENDICTYLSCSGDNCVSTDNKDDVKDIVDDVNSVETSFTSETDIETLKTPLIIIAVSVGLALTIIGLSIAFKLIKNVRNN